MLSDPRAANAVLEGNPSMRSRFRSPGRRRRFHSQHRRGLRPPPCPGVRRRPGTGPRSRLRLRPDPRRPAGRPPSRRRLDGKRRLSSRRDVLPVPGGLRPLPSGRPGKGGLPSPSAPAPRDWEAPLTPDCCGSTPAASTISWPTSSARVFTVDYRSCRCRPSGSGPGRGRRLAFPLRTDCRRKR